ncbi:MAG: saccharopine dehydrogenase NADP-binding domain-containing protein [Candidatus Obscuribacterales bacterium]|nr:saccharopine dehydrogenase NADP-binding domain-containing protein [Candidatus Obscuribacterales bacterium]
MIGIIGATGFTGKLVASELKKRKTNFFIAGRNEQLLRTMSESLGDTKYRIIDVQDSATFKALDGCKIIINCAGPFTDFGEPVVQEAIARGCHYLDTTGEQGFIKLVYDKYHEQAKSTNIVLVPACAYEYAITDAMGAELWKNFPECSAMEFIYSLKGMYTSPGTRKSIVRAMAAPAFFLQNGKLVESRSATLSRKTQLNGRAVSIMSFPGGESLMIPRHTKVMDVNTFLAAEAPPMLLQASAAFGQFIMKVAGDFIVNRTTTQVPSNEQRKNTTFVIQANTKIGTDSQSITVTGNDPYWLTAVIVTGAAIQLQANPPRELGAITPTMISGSDFIRNLLEKSGTKWVASC